MKKMFDEMLETARKNRTVILALSLIAVSCAAAWKWGADGVSGFGLNAFTETLGIVITVLVVDHLLQRQSERRLLPQRAAAYEDTRLFLARLVSFWTDALRDSTDRPPPSDLEVLFSWQTFDEIQRYLDLNGEPNVIPKRKWFDWFPEQYAEQQQRGNRILERHNSILDPEAYAMVHQICTEGPDGKIVSIIRQTDQRNGIPRPSNLGAHWGRPDGYLDSVLGLLIWARKEEEYLRKNQIKRIKAAPATMQSWNKDNCGKSRLSDEKLGQQTQAFRAWQEQSAGKSVDN